MNLSLDFSNFASKMADSEWRTQIFFYIRLKTLKFITNEFQGSLITNLISGFLNDVSKMANSKMRPLKPFRYEFQSIGINIGNLLARHFRSAILDTQFLKSDVKLLFSDPKNPLEMNSRVFVPIQGKRYIRHFRSAILDAEFSESHVIFLFSDPKNLCIPNLKGILSLFASIMNFYPKIQFFSSLFI